MTKLQLQIPKQLRPVFESFGSRKTGEIVLQMIDYFYDGIEPTENDQEWIYVKSVMDMEKAGIFGV